MCASHAVLAALLVCAMASYSSVPGARCLVSWLSLTVPALRHTATTESACSPATQSASPPRSGVIDQDAAVEEVIAHISSHFRVAANKLHPRKPLVLVLGGDRGTGKLNLIKRLVRRVYVNADATGMSGHGIMWYTQPHVADASRVMAEIAEHVYYCTRSFIVLEDADIALVDALAPILSTVGSIDIAGRHVDFGNAVIIITTPSPGQVIDARYTELVRLRDRQLLTASDFASCFGEYDRGYVNALIPFLPLGHGAVVKAFAWMLEQYQCHGRSDMPTHSLAVVPDTPSLTACLATLHAGTRGSGLDFVEETFALHFISVVKDAIQPSLFTQLQQVLEQESDRGYRHVVVRVSKYCSVTATLSTDTHIASSRDDL